MSKNRVAMSDVDFIGFYQEPMAFLFVGGDSDMYPMAGSLEESMPDYEEKSVEERERQWYEKAIASLTRLGAANLICCGGEEGDFTSALRRMFYNRDERTWRNFIFDLTKEGVELARRFRMDINEESYMKVVFPDFREELERIFDEHGVGLDMDLPYDKLLSLDGE